MDVLSFALFELGYTSLDEVLEITWREFTLKREGWKRENIRKWEHTRHISYYVYCSIPEKGKKKPMNSFMPLPSDSENVYVVNDDTRDTLRKMQLEYHNKVNNK